MTATATLTARPSPGISLGAQPVPSPCLVVNSVPGHRILRAEDGRPLLADDGSVIFAEAE